MSTRIVMAIAGGVAAGFAADRLLDTEWRATTLLAIAAVWIIYLTRSNQRRHPR
jgi:hypothetical protein